MLGECAEKAKRVVKWPTGCAPKARQRAQKKSLEVWAKRQQLWDTVRELERLEKLESHVYGGRAGGRLGQGLPNRPGVYCYPKGAVSGNLYG